MNVFFLVFARDKKHVCEKIGELSDLNVQYKIVCGDYLNHPNVVYKTPKGKYNAINFGTSLIPPGTDIVVMNDVDTRIHNFNQALKYFKDPQVALVFGTELVKKGPQNLFYRIQNPIRRRLPISGSGELMLIRAPILIKVLYPLKSCKAEDTYILFKLLEKKYKIVFCEDCCAETVRTSNSKDEEAYKRRTVGGIYQALGYSNPPIAIKLFYYCLPFISPLLLILGRNGYYWTRGILLGLNDFLRGDRIGFWKPIGG